ncbi:class I adenylate-forming enzyme family protein [Sphingomonas sp. YL-JM2C]
MSALTLGELLERSAALHPQKEALVVGHERVCYAEVLAASKRTAAALAALNVKPRDRVGILATSSIDYINVLFGSILLDAIPVLLNNSWPDEYFPACFKALGLKTLITSAGELHDRATAIVEAEKLPIAIHPIAQLVGANSARPVKPAANRAKSTHPAVVVFTAGTTGVPKPCCLTHETLTIKTASFVERTEFREDSRLWLGVPMYQVGFLAPLISAITIGATVIATTSAGAETDRMTLIEEAVTHAYPIYLHRWLPIAYGPGFKASDFPRLSHLCLIGPARTLRRVQRGLPQCVVMSIYGGPEGGGGYCMPRPDDPAAIRLESCGKPFSGHELRIVSPKDGQVLARQQIGEIQARGPGIPQTCDLGGRRSSFTEDGWLRTGDIGMLNDAGDLIYFGRESEMLKIGDDVVPASRLEALLLDYPDVAMAQILPIPDDALGEAVWAFIEPRPGTNIAAAEIIDFCRARMPENQLPRAITFVEDWPVSASKIQKILLYDLPKDWRSA